MRYVCIAILLISFNILSTYAKGNDTIITKERYSETRFGMDYASVNTYNGRKDTNKIRVLSPSFQYVGKRGFYTNLSLVNVPHAKKLFDELNTNFGWQHDFSNDWDANVSFSHFFYDSKVARINAAISNALNINLGKDWDVLYTNLDFNIDASNNKFPYRGKIIAQKSRDVFFDFSNAHEFAYSPSLSNGDSLKIIPKADILFGTQNFLVTYRGKTNLADKVYRKDAAKFKLTGYVISASLKYEIKKLTFELRPDYFIPKNVPTGESATPFFVMNGAIYFTFKKKKEKHNSKIS